MTTSVGDIDKTIVLATRADAKNLSQVIADAFHDLPPSRWLIRDATLRRAVFPAYFGLFVAHALEIGVVYTTLNRDAAALWVPIPETGPTPPINYKGRLVQATRPWTQRFFTFDAALDRRYPIGIAHHHLAILGVRPDRQGHGIGTALLRAQHAALDRESRPAYLEAATWRLRHLYMANGYRDHGEPIELPDGPTMYPMWREPRSHSAGRLH